MARTDNMVSIKNRHKQIFNETLTDSTLAAISNKYSNDIQTLKELARRDLESHEFANPKYRMERYSAIAKKCSEGFPTGALDATGMPVFKEDPKTELDAIKAGKDEQQAIIQNDLKLLQIMVLRERQNNYTPPPSLESNGTQVKVIAPSDNDKYFDD